MIHSSYIMLILVIYSSQPSLQEHVELQPTTNAVVVVTAQVVHQTASATHSVIPVVIAVLISETPVP